MILEALFRGNLLPADIVHPTDPEYKKLNHEICELQDQLIPHLSEENKKLLDKLIATIYAAQTIESESYFVFAFVVGMELQQEIQTQMMSLQEE